MEVVEEHPSVGVPYYVKSFLGIIGKKMDHLQSSALKYRQMRAEQGLSVVKTPFERHLERPDSRSRAIAAKCWDCQGRDYDPHVRWRIGNCEVGPVRDVKGEQVGCPLYTVRPYQDLYQRPDTDHVA